MWKWFLAAAAWQAVLAPSPAAASDLPFRPDEMLRYTVNWPSGLGLGEGDMSARLTKAPSGDVTGWQFEFRIEAAVPGFTVADHYLASATRTLCSVEFEKGLVHGRRTGKEKTTFSEGTARRKTTGGGTSDIPVGDCARDGLTFLYYLRSELAQGRIPATQTVLFGAPYEVSFQYGGRQPVVLGDSRVDGDRLIATVKGPASKFTFEVVVAQDPGRTPVRIKVPLELGDFTMELNP
ncbi:MAG: DUF3108 domain-containing protein [Bryobacteraceae bacterium]|nr:DUF3108 domain-containing protein [Bryobacteraceae bacterium]